MNTEQSVEDLERAVLGGLFPTDPKFYRLESMYNNGTRSSIDFKGAKKISDLGIENNSILMVSIVKGRDSRVCASHTMEGVRSWLAKDKSDKAAEKKAKKQAAAKKVANVNAPKKLKAAVMHGDGIRLGDGEVIRAPTKKQKKSVQVGHPGAVNGATELVDTIRGRDRAADAIDLSDGDIGDLTNMTNGHWRGKMQDTLNEQIMLGNDNMQLDCIKSGNYSFKLVENVNYLGNIAEDVEMKLITVRCNPVGEAKNLSTQRSLRVNLWLEVNGTLGRQVVASAHKKSLETGKWGWFHPNFLMLEDPALIWSMVIKCNMDKGVDECHPWGKSHPWSYIELLKTFAQDLDWSGVDFEEPRLRHRKRVHYDE